MKDNSNGSPASQEKLNQIMRGLKVISVSVSEPLVFLDKEFKIISVNPDYLPLWVADGGN